MARSSVDKDPAANEPSFRRVRFTKSRKTIGRALEVAQQAGICRVLDVNLRPPFFDEALIRESVEFASVLKLSDDEFDLVATACAVDSAENREAVLRGLLERYQLDLVVLTRGAMGAMLVSAAETIDQPGIPTTVRDTVGAGDAFTAVLIAGLLRGESLPAIARDACRRAAAQCAEPGAGPKLPENL